MYNKNKALSWGSNDGYHKTYEVLNRDVSINQDKVIQTNFTNYLGDSPNVVFDISDDYFSDSLQDTCEELSHIEFDLQDNDLKLDPACKTPDLSEKCRTLIINKFDYETIYDIKIRYIFKDGDNKMGKPYPDTDKPPISIKIHAECPTGVTVSKSPL